MAISVYTDSDRKNLLKSYPVVTNYSLTILHVFLAAYVLFIFPLYILPRGLGLSVSIILIALLSNQLWALIHDAVHRSLAPTQAINELAGRVIAVSFGAPLALLRDAHMMHHKYNRSVLERLELYDPNQETKWRAGLRYYFYLLGGLYLVEVLAPLLFFLPRTKLRSLAEGMSKSNTINAKIAQRLVSSDSTIRGIRVDFAIILGLFVASLICYGEYGWLLVIFFAMRAFLISFLDYIYHYQSPVDQVLHGYNLFLPPLLCKLLLNFNYHGMHHRYPAASWKVLPELFRQDNGKFDGNYFYRSLLQLKGPMTLETLTSKLDLGSVLSP